MRKLTNVFQAVMFSLLAFAAYELKAEEPNASKFQSQLNPVQ